jgi:hypothetical protein
MAVITIAATTPAIKGTESGAEAEDASSLLASSIVSLTVLEVAILLVGDNVDDRVVERKFVVIDRVVVVVEVVLVLNSGKQEKLHEMRDSRLIASKRVTKKWNS